jgi:hypothetical protein
MAEVETMALEPAPNHHQLTIARPQSESVAKPDEVLFDIDDPESDSSRELPTIEQWKPSESVLESGMQMQYSSTDPGDAPSRRIPSEPSSRCFFVVFAMLTFSLLVLRNFGQQGLADRISRRSNLSPVSTWEGIYGPVDSSMHRTMDTRPSTNRYLGSVAFAVGAVASKGSHGRAMVLEGASRFVVVPSTSPSRLVDPTLKYTLSAQSQITFSSESASTSLAWETSEGPVMFSPLQGGRQIKSIWDALVVEEGIAVCVTIIESNSTNQSTQSLAVVGCSRSTLSCSMTIVKEVKATVPLLEQWLRSCRFTGSSTGDQAGPSPLLLSCLDKTGTMSLLTLSGPLTALTYDQTQLHAVLVASPMVSTTISGAEWKFISFIVTSDQQMLSLTWTSTNRFSWQPILDSPFPFEGQSRCVGASAINSSESNHATELMRSSSGEFHWFVLGYHLTVRQSESASWNVSLHCIPLPLNDAVKGITAAGAGVLFLTMRSPDAVPRLWYAEILDVASMIESSEGLILTPLPLLGLNLPNPLSMDHALRLGYEPSGQALTSGSVTVRAPSVGFTFTAPLTIDPVRWGSLEGSLVALWTMAIE